MPSKAHLSPVSSSHDYQLPPLKLSPTHVPRRTKLSQSSSETSVLNTLELHEQRLKQLVNRVQMYEPLYSHRVRSKKKLFETALERSKSIEEEHRYKILEQNIALITRLQQVEPTVNVKQFPKSIENARRNKIIRDLISKQTSGVITKKSRSPSSEDLFSSNIQIIQKLEAASSRINCWNTAFRLEDSSKVEVEERRQIIRDKLNNLTRQIGKLHQKRAINTPFKQPERRQQFQAPSFYKQSQGFKNGYQLRTGQGNLFKKPIIGRKKVTKRFFSQPCRETEQPTHKGAQTSQSSQLTKTQSARAQIFKKAFRRCGTDKSTVNY